MPSGTPILSRGRRFGKRHPRRAYPSFAPHFLGPYNSSSRPTTRCPGNVRMENSQPADALKPKYRRVVLKVSGEGFGMRGQSGISIDETLLFASQAKRVFERGVQLAIVVGGGNILRGHQFSAGGAVIREATAHYMGMLATVMNGMALQDALE